VEKRYEMAKKKKAVRKAKGFAPYAKGKAAREKVDKVMHEFKHGELHTGSKKGPKVKSRKQAVAIALNQARKLSK